MTVEWIDPPDTKASKAQRKADEVAAQLAARPNTWARVLKDGPVLAGAWTADWIVNLRGNPNLEVRVVPTAGPLGPRDVYARWVPIADDDFDYDAADAAERAEREWAEATPGQRAAFAAMHGELRYGPQGMRPYGPRPPANPEGDET